MRFFSIITALLVMATLYLFVFEREKLVSFAVNLGGGAPAQQDGAQGDTRDSAAAASADAVSTPGGSDTEEQVFSVVVQKSTASEIAAAVLVRGRTEAARQVAVRAETSGQVISDPLRKGAEVTAGQLLCKLDPGTREISLKEARARLAEAKARVPVSEAQLPEARARLAEARARLNEAEIALRAAQRLSEDGFASESRLAAAQAGYESALAAVESAKSGVANALSGIQSARAGVQSAEAAVAAAMREISRLSITAPFGGLLESDAAETGSLLQPGALCATIIQLDPMKLVGYVPETEVSRVTPGARAGARLANGDQVAGKVTFISRSADQNTRTFRIEVQVPNTDLSIRDGQTAEMIIETAGEAAHLLPLSSLTLNDDGDLGVRVVDDASRVRFLPVKVSRDTVDGVWVTGLPDAVDVIVTGQEYVVDGVRVNAVYKESGQ